jgi:putative tricarboxylic transport membrane protein
MRILKTYLLLAAGLVITAGSAAQGWRPERAIEIITSSDAGGSNDQVARVIQKLVQDARQVPTPINVMNKPGGNQTIAVVYLNSFAANPHYLLLANPTLFGNQLAGITQTSYLDLTPVALLINEHSAISVRAASPFKTMRDVIDKLKADPTALAIGTVARGGPNHLTLALALRAGGVEVRKLKVAIFKTNADSMTALAGGHLDLVVSSVGSALPQIQAGGARMLAVAAPRRLSGQLAQVPTLKEQGINSSLDSWRAIFGPKNMPAAGVAYWEEVLAKMTSSAEWKKEAENRDWDPQFMRSKEFAKYLEVEYADTKLIMTELGLVK